MQKKENYTGNSADKDKYKELYDGQIITPNSVVIAYFVAGLIALGTWGLLESSYHPSTKNTDCVELHTAELLKSLEIKVIDIFK